MLFDSNQPIRKSIGGLVLALAADASLLVLGACAVDHQQSQPSLFGSRTPDSGVRLRLSLAGRRAVAGHPIHGTLTVLNTTGAPVRVSCGLSSWAAIGLRNRDVAFQATFDVPICASQAALKPGTTQFAISVPTTYGQCTESGSPVLGIPRCVASRGKPSRRTPPPLPVGRYWTVVVLDGPTYQGFALSAPIPVTIRH